VRFKHRGFLDRDAITALQDALDDREEKTGSKLKIGEPIFLSKHGSPISGGWIYDHFTTIADRAKLRHLRAGYENSYNMDAHETRDLLKSIAKDCKVDADARDHFIGHKPKDSYEKESIHYPETLRREFMKMSKRPNMFGKFANVVSGKNDTDELRAELNQKMQELDRTLKQEKSEYIKRERNNILAESQKNTLDKILENSENQAKTMESLKEEIEKLKSGEKKLEFCRIDCEMVHCESKCPACGSKMRRIYEEKLSN